ncbi:MAG TPA: hypothetical protein VMD09_02425 [Solirubrobacteraceae bacterium]|nr:hypothetical protein [Solirubrobacteraceae bacterium]
MILAGTLLAALFLLVAEFTTLYQVHEAGTSAPIKTVTGGSNHAYAMLVIALGAIGLGVLVWRSGSRSALLALGILGVVALLIALLGDLPDSEATGLAGSAGHGYVNASSTPSAGLYLETLGAILLIATSGLGFLTLGPRARRRSGGPPGPEPPGPRAPSGNGKGENDAPAWTRTRQGGSRRGR